MSDPEDTEGFREQSDSLELPTDSNETIKGSLLIEYAEDIVETWDYSAHSEQENSRLVLEHIHWLMETFGQGKPESGFRVFPGGSDKAILGEELPSSLHHLITSVYQDEP